MIPMSAMISERPGRVLRALGCRWVESRTARFSWGELSKGWGLALQLINFGGDYDHWSLHLQMIFGQAYIRVPFLPKREPAETMDSWGFSWPWSIDDYGTAIHLRWGNRSRILYTPWHLEFIRHSVLRADGEWVPFVGSWEVAPGLTRQDGTAAFPLKEPDGRAIETHPYRYICDDGRVQQVTATIYVEEWEHRWRWFTWLRWPRRVSRSISVTFSDEVGDRAGSYKGGTTGCDYTMRRGETPVECLYRMQRERRFR